MPARKAPAKPEPKPKEPIEVKKTGDGKATMSINDLAVLKKLGLDGLGPKELEAEVNRRVLAAAAEKRKPGRPAPPVPKKSRPLNLDQDVWDALADRAATQDSSLSAVANDLLRRALLDT